MLGGIEQRETHQLRPSMMLFSELVGLALLDPPYTRTDSLNPLIPHGTTRRRVMPLHRVGIAADWLARI